MEARVLAIQNADCWVICSVPVPDCEIDGLVIMGDGIVMTYIVEISSVCTDGVLRMCNTGVTELIEKLAPFRVAWSSLWHCLLW